MEKWQNDEIDYVVELQRLFQEGIDSGPSEDAEFVFSRLRAKYVAMAEIHRDGSRDCLRRRMT